MNEVLKNDTAITLDWNDVTGANQYHLQVSVDQADFSGSLLVNDSALAASTKSFTDTGTNNKKRFWRWRSSTDAGSTWGAWSEVGSYWLNTSAAGDVSITADGWKIFDPDLVTDIYTFALFPVYRIVHDRIPRLFTRNRAGELLSEFITIKSMITLSYEGKQYMELTQHTEIIRFNLEIKTFFLATNKTNEVDNVPNIWLVQFETDPEISMIAAGRQDLFQGQLKFIEV